MNLDDIYRVDLPRKKRKRIGRGPGSGHGKTSGRGIKGAKSRSGWGGKLLYEGGQMPLTRRVPVRGFTNARFKVEYEIINLAKIDSRFQAGDTVDRKALIKHGLVSSSDALVKILADGDFTKPLTIVADKFSSAARTKIEALGGTAKVRKGRLPTGPRRRSSDRRPS